MADLFDNPMGLMGFEFVEFAAPDADALGPLFEKLGFSLVARHRSKDVLLYRQGAINFIVNREPRSAAAYFAAEHGPSACGLAFRVKDSHKAYARALELGAQLLAHQAVEQGQGRLVAGDGLAGGGVDGAGGLQEAQGAQDVGQRQRRQGVRRRRCRGLGRGLGLVVVVVRRGHRRTPCRVARRRGRRPRGCR